MRARINRRWQDARHLPRSRARVDRARRRRSSVDVEHRPQRRAARAHAHRPRRAHRRRLDPRPTPRWARTPTSSPTRVSSDADHRRARDRSARSRTCGPAPSVGPDAHVGNFVETKKTRLGRGSKANHLTYLGDATIGEKVNIGAGTITCNYNGYEKTQTIIEDGAFIGSRHAARRARAGGQAGPSSAAGTTGRRQDVPRGRARDRAVRRPGRRSRSREAPRVQGREEGRSKNGYVRVDSRKYRLKIGVTEVPMPTSVKAFFDQKVPAALATQPREGQGRRGHLPVQGRGPDGGTWTVDLVSTPPTCVPGEAGDTPSARSRRPTTTSAR